MPLVFPRRAVACALLICAGGAIAAPADEASSFDSLLTHGSSVAIRQGTVTDEVAHSGRLQQYANGESLLFQGGDGDAGDAPVMLLLCERLAYFNTVGGLPAGQSPSGELLKATRLGQYMALIGGVAMVQDAADRTLDLPADGATLDTTIETEWAYGKEQFSLSAKRLADQSVHLRMVKLGNRTTIPATDSDDLFSTDEDRAARLAELAPVGAWSELVISAEPRAAEVPAEMSLKGWVGNSGQLMTTVGEARKACGSR
ncbi:MAG TPA: hypothetical protein VM469_04430 [Pseudoxanthomonas sp.]|nr:hypothetical protein [Pseudoxanthomonas sp.]